MTIKQPNLIQPTVGATNTNTLSPSSSDLNIYTEIGSSMGLTLIVIIGFILLLGWLAKRMGWKKTTEQWIDVKATYNINPKERIMVIHVDNQLLVVGVTPQQMTLLHTINEERTKVLLSQNGADKNLTKINSFQQILQSALKVKKE
ncbi:MAG: flagellar biosynthetic protein FliO [Gilliamella sp.]|uniref:flagellar biosynthetic protein FliO n=1 Tax=unclassified Gilliamella TaxID=2685620 RepID=UPI0015810086|nr:MULTISPECIES: flagellar biosynthetic protein FliO [unclassified Gilliamella]MCO6536409.1 flagellar biosynthetic protein FliO [Gilliamella sp.]MCO6539357.1 flagellar biosynthetic protein FliO [Gilliamella sp.]MCO6554263.1 flagellar biosynthetic protein FliO [Gilliamella sp.]NUE96640.1 flagellar biosynthetic protein FliO [Gilliamella sp. ESL0232]